MIVHVSFFEVSKVDVAVIVIDPVAPVKIFTVPSASTVVCSVSEVDHVTVCGAKLVVCTVAVSLVSVPADIVSASGDTVTLVTVGTPSTIATAFAKGDTPNTRPT